MRLITVLNRCTEFKRFVMEESRFDEHGKIMVRLRSRKNSKGESSHWSIGQLLTNPNLIEALIQGPYKKPALIPATPWLDKTAPSAPQVKFVVEDDTVQISWSHLNNDEVARWVVYFKYDRSWNYQILGSNSQSLALSAFNLKMDRQKVPHNNARELEVPAELLSQVRVTAVDRAGNESQANTLLISGISPPDPSSNWMQASPSSPSPLQWGVPWLVNQEL